MKYKNPWTSFTSSKKKPKESVHTVQPPRSLLDAIGNRNLVSFQYEGTVREVEPYACGVLDNGRTVLVAFQTAGQARSGDRPMWRTFSVEDIGNLQIQNRQFLQNREGYNPFDDRMNPLFGKVK